MEHESTLCSLFHEEHELESETVFHETHYHILSSLWNLVFHLELGAKKHVKEHVFYCVPYVKSGTCVCLVVVIIDFVCHMAHACALW